jgi:hypothetical protein
MHVLSSRATTKKISRGIKKVDRGNKLEDTNQYLLTQKKKEKQKSIREIKSSK